MENAIAQNPVVGDVIPVLGGVRKVRFGLGGRGKRGGGRAAYFLMLSEDAAIMLFAYEKSSQSDLSPEQRKAALQLIKELAHAAKR